MAAKLNLDDKAYPWSSSPPSAHCLKIIDYSLLLGVHFPRQSSCQGKISNSGSTRNFEELDEESIFQEMYPSYADKVTNHMKLDESAKSDLLLLISHHLHGGIIQKKETLAPERSLTMFLQNQVKMGRNMPAMCVPTNEYDIVSEEPCVLCFGIIDILQVRRLIELTCAGSRGCSTM